MFILFDTLNIEEKNKIIKFKENKKFKTPFEIKHISFITYEKYYEDLIRHSNYSTINSNNNNDKNYNNNNNNNNNNIVYSKLFFIFTIINLCFFFQ
jgi:hypothetical protein